MLRDVSFKNTYSTGMNEPKEFFTEALIESKYFDLGLGFFSSSGIHSLAYGFALFVANGGKMRVVINDILSDADKNAILNGKLNSISDKVCEKIISDIEKMKETFSKADELFFRCFSYLISQKRFEFVATLSAKGGLGHDKYGIFTDEVGDKVAFIGSSNFSMTAMELNGETITSFASWTADKIRVDEYQELFNQSWEKDTTHLIHIPLERVKSFVKENFKAGTPKELIGAGIDIREFDNSAISKQKLTPLPQRIIDKLEFKESEPRFPFPEERDIQTKAYTSWLFNKRTGIFAMATGSGKTVTALNCILKEYKIHGYYRAIIVVPTQALAVQWEKECKNFNFSNIVSTHTTRNWKSEISRYITQSIFGSAQDIIIITTYATFNRKDMQFFVRKTKNIDDFIYVADEAHNLGSSSCLKTLPVQITKRIGLSATPERVYDEKGSKQMYDFFNSYPPLYTYRYTMKQAIDSGILCKYDYHPIFVKLSNVEMKEYLRITEQLRKFIDPETMTYKPEADKLLLKRKRVIHKAVNKKDAIIKLLESLQDDDKLNYTFVFVPEGYEPDYSEKESYEVQGEDLHIIDEYSKLFKEHGYRYHQYVSGMNFPERVLSHFASGDIQILLSMKCLDEGVDIPRAEYAIFCSSTGNPRQFVQRRGRVLRKCEEKEKATIWDLVVLPVDTDDESTGQVEANLFQNEVRRIINFAALAENKISILYGPLADLCDQYNIDEFKLLEEELKQYS